MTKWSTNLKNFVLIPPSWSVMFRRHVNTSNIRACWKVQKICANFFLSLNLLKWNFHQLRLITWTKTSHFDDIYSLHCIVIHETKYNIYKNRWEFFTGLLWMIRDTTAPMSSAACKMAGFYRYLNLRLTTVLCAR